MRIWVRSGAECIVDPRGPTFYAEPKRETRTEPAIRRNETPAHVFAPTPGQRKLMLVSDFQGSAVAPRTPLELWCFAV
jgi:hypothetical protein